VNDTASKPAVPLSFWLIAGLSLLWNAFGGYDYTMTMTRNTEYLSAMGPPAEIIAWVEGFPLWASIAYALGVWGSVAGSVLLLLRSRHAVTAFLVSMVSAAVSFAAQFSSQLPPSLDTTMHKVIPLVILVIIALLWWWSKRKAADGTLR
jgi:hypothetical protein